MSSTIDRAARVLAICSLLLADPNYNDDMKMAFITSVISTGFDHERPSCSELKDFIELCKERGLPVPAWADELHEIIHHWMAFIAGEQLEQGDPTNLLRMLGVEVHVISSAEDVEKLKRMTN